MIPIPPDVPATERSISDIPVRYEDIGQDGHLLAHGMPQALGAVFWRDTAPRLLGGLRGQGVVPILTRLATEGGQAPLGIVAPLRGEGRHELAHTRDPTGEVSRIVLRVWVDLTGKRARVYGPPPERAGEPLFAGRVYSEHVFTRLFAPPGERKVLALDAPDLPAVPPRELVWSPQSALLTPPADAQIIDALRVDPEPVFFGSDHVDSNRHVNSLVYPRLFRDIALRRLARLGERTADLHVVSQETSFMRPCFAGDELAVASLAYRRGDRLGACFALFPPDADMVERGRSFGVVEFGTG